MLWAAACLGFFGFLRSGEMTVPTDSSYDPAVHLSRNDVAVDNAQKPAVLRVTIKQTKTDPFRKGIDLFLGKTATDLCPVTAMLNYLVVRGKQQGPLFMFRDGRFLTRERLVMAVRAALQKAGLDCANTVDTASGLGRQRRQPAEGWRMPSSRPWVDGGAWPTWNILRSHGNSWQTTPAYWHLRESLGGDGHEWQGHNICGCHNSICTHVS